MSERDELIQSLRRAGGGENMIKLCSLCKPHIEQDKKYGKNMRVMNPLKKMKDMPQQYRCTICSAIH